MNANIKTFKQNVKYLRKKNNYTLQRFADILNISKSMVSSFEYSDANYSLSTIISISRLFDISLDDLFFTDLTHEG